MCLLILKLYCSCVPTSNLDFKLPSWHLLLPLILASDVSILPSSLGGRGLFTKKSFGERDLIFEERPLVWQLRSSPSFICIAPRSGESNSNNNQLNCCLHCSSYLGPFTSLLSLFAADLDRPPPSPNSLAQTASIHPKLPQPLNCSNCSAQYCSSTCKDAAEVEYHSRLCPGRSVRLASPFSHFISPPLKPNAANFWHVVQSEPEARLEMAAKILCRLIQRPQDQPHSAAVEDLLGGYCAVPWTSFYCNEGLNNILSPFHFFSFHL